MTTGADEDPRGARPSSLEEEPRTRGRSAGAQGRRPMTRVSSVPVPGRADLHSRGEGGPVEDPRIGRSCPSSPLHARCSLAGAEPSQRDRKNRAAGTNGWSFRNGSLPKANSRPTAVWPPGRSGLLCEECSRGRVRRCQRLTRAARGPIVYPPRRRTSPTTAWFRSLATGRHRP